MKAVIPELDVRPTTKSKLIALGIHVAPIRSESGEIEAFELLGARNIGRNHTAFQILIKEFPE